MNGKELKMVFEKMLAENLEGDMDYDGMSAGDWHLEFGAFLKNHFEAIGDQVEVKELVDAGVDY